MGCAFWSWGSGTWPNYQAIYINGLFEIVFKVCGVFLASNDSKGGREKKRHLSVWKSQTVYLSIIRLGKKMKNPLIAGRSKSLLGSVICKEMRKKEFLVPFNDKGNNYIWQWATQLQHN